MTLVKIAGRESLKFDIFFNNCIDKHSFPRCRCFLNIKY